MKQFITEFKQFISRGNVMDLAVGVIIGGAFKEIVDAFTNGILMPLLSLAVGAPGFNMLFFTIGKTVFPYGGLLQAIFNFLMMAFVLFCIIKATNLFHKKKETAPPPPPKPSNEEVLLTEIRDLLAARQEK